MSIIIICKVVGGELLNDQCETCITYRFTANMMTCTLRLVSVHVIVHNASYIQLQNVNLKNNNSSTFRTDYHRDLYLSIQSIFIFTL